MILSGGCSEWLFSPVQSPAPWAGPPSFTCFTKIVSIGSSLFRCLPREREDGKYYTQSWKINHFRCPWKTFKRNVALQKLINDYKTITTFKKTVVKIIFLLQHLKKLKKKKHLKNIQKNTNTKIYLLHLIFSEMRHSYDLHPRLKSNAYWHLRRRECLCLIMRELWGVSQDLRHVKPHFDGKSDWGALHR